MPFTNAEKQRRFRVLISSKLVTRTLSNYVHRTAPHLIKFIKHLQRTAIKCRLTKQLRAIQQGHLRKLSVCVVSPDSAPGSLHRRPHSLTQITDVHPINFSRPGKIKPPTNCMHRHHDCLSTIASTRSNFTASVPPAIKYRPYTPDKTIT